MCLLTSLVISNMLTLDLPPKTFFSLSSALIWRRFFWSCRLCFLMYAQRFLVIWPRGMALVPTISASVALGVIGFISAALGLRALFLTAFFATFLVATFFGAAFFRSTFFTGAFFAPFLSCAFRSAEHPSELHSLFPLSFSVFFFYLY